MPDDELRERLASWARTLDRPTPPDLSQIRRLARRRTARRAAAAAVASAAVAAAVALIIALPGRAPAPVIRTSIPPSPVASRPPGEPATARVPFYLSIARYGARSAQVRRTASGALAATVAAPAGLLFDGVAAAGRPRTFVLAAQQAADGGPVRFYRLSLATDGKPGPLRATSIPAVRLGLRHGCLSQLAGLAVTPDGSALAFSTLSDCANGRAGAALIEVVSLHSGKVLHAVRPAGDYPMWLSWTTAGTLVYRWHESVWSIPAAAAPGHAALSPRPLITYAGFGKFSPASDPMITPDGRILIATGSGPGGSLEVAEFSAVTGRKLRVLVTGSGDALAYCGPLWTGADARHVLAACGDGAEVSVDGGRITRVGPIWRLPDYPVPGPPQIAW